MTKHVPKKARVLLYDIETAPNLAWVWGKYQQDVIAYDEEWYMLCFAYKWLGERQTHIVALPDFKGYKKGSTDDKQLVTKLHSLFEEADVVIAHNGDSFDQKKSNARFAVHGLVPPARYRSIDTRKEARKYFKFNSNKLDDLGQLLGVGKKLKTGGFDLWLGCMEGNQRAWATMKKYNKQDVVLLEKVYLKLLPWMNTHPAMNLMEDNALACPKCFKEGTMVPHQRYWYAKTTVRWQYRCLSCGGITIDRKAQKVTNPVEVTN